MGLVGGARKLVRALPVSPRVTHRLRQTAGLGFQVSAYLRHGKDRSPERPRPGPIAVVGFHGSVLGIGEGARAFSAALRNAGAEVIDWDISHLFGHQRRLQTTASTEPPERVQRVVIHLNPRELIQLVAMVGAGPFRGRFCVGYWAWELEQAPRSWRAALRYIDEIWTPSAFVAHAVETLAVGARPVRVFPHPIAVLSPQSADRARWGVEPGVEAVLTAFDLRSGFVRKNSIAAVRAFRAAAALAKGPAVLICKATGTGGEAALFATLMAEIGEATDVRLVTDWLSDADMASLIASVDIVLSLHRSEGFGLLLAGAMAAKKAVVATGWSGNMDYMNTNNSALVDYRLIPVRDPQGLYPGGRWAEPDMTDAIEKLAALIANPSVRKTLGERAAADVAERLDPVRLGRQARVWLGDDA